MKRTKGFGVIAVTMIVSLAGAALSAYAYADQTTRVSVNSDRLAANLGATNGALSADGLYVVFQSSATNLVPDTTGIQQVFRHDRTTGATNLVSIATTGRPGNNVSRDPSVSRDGRYVVFSSFATDLIARDANGELPDVFRRDMRTGMTELVSANAAGDQANMGSGLSGLAGARAISDDGGFVAFTSNATNLVATANNSRQQVYVKDMDTDEVVLASVTDAGLAGDQGSERPVISGNGRVVAFNSTSTNLSPLSRSGFAQVFVHDLDSHTTSLESVATSGLPHAGRHSTAPALSFEGRYVAFESQAVLDTSDLDNALLDVYLRDRAAPGSTVLASLSNNIFSFGGPNSARASISGDGRWIAFDSLDERLFTGDVGGWTDIFVYDRDHVVHHTPAIALVSRNDAGDQANQSSFGPSLSSDGHLVLFGSTASNLVPSAPVGTNQLYVRKLVDDAPPPPPQVTLEWLAPVSDTFSVNRNLPVKFTVHDLDGAPVFDTSVQVDVVDSSGAVVAGTYTFGDQPSRFVTWNGDAYHVNVDTRTIEPGMYWLRVRFSSATLSAEFTLATNGTASALRSGGLRD